MIQRTEQYLDAIVSRHGKSWSAGYRRRFTEMADNVAKHSASPAITNKKTIKNEQRAAEFAAIRLRILGLPDKKISHGVCCGVAADELETYTRIK